MKKLNKRVYTLEDHLKAIEHKIEQNERSISRNIRDINIHLKALYEFLEIETDSFGAPVLTVKPKEE